MQGKKKLSQDFPSMHVSHFLDLDQNFLCVCDWPKNWGSDGCLALSSNFLLPLDLSLLNCKYWLPSQDFKRNGINLSKRRKRLSSTSVSFKQTKMEVKQEGKTLSRPRTKTRGLCALPRGEKMRMWQGQLKFTRRVSLRTRTSFPSPNCCSLVRLFTHRAHLPPLQHDTITELSTVKWISESNFQFVHSRWGIFHWKFRLSWDSSTKLITKSHARSLMMTNASVRHFTKVTCLSYSRFLRHNGHFSARQTW